MGIQDPRLRSLVERFTDVRLSGFKNRVFEFFDAGDDVAHLFAASVLEFEVHSQSLFKGSPFEVSVRPFFPYFEQRSQSLAARVRTAREG